MKTKSKKAIEREALRAWASYALKIGNNKCAKCGKTKNLNVHHLISKHIKATRLDKDNAIVLCAGCHRFNKICSAHQGPLGFFMWFLWERGEVDRARRLLAKVNKGV
jgi:hypothetical protein